MGRHETKMFTYLGKANEEGNEGKSLRERSIWILFDEATLHSKHPQLEIGCRRHDK